MTHLAQQTGDPDTRVGRRRGILDLAHIDLNVHWGRAEPDSAGFAETYPSPPMSGSPPPPLPPLPSKTSQEVGVRTQTIFQAPPQDVYRGLPSTHGDVRSQAPGSGNIRPLTAEAADRPAYSFPIPDTSVPRPLSFLPPQVPMLSQPPYHLGPGPSMSVFAAANRGPVPEMSGPELTKAQRKTKGHVASACVPCKRAHLRCVTRSCKKTTAHFLDPC
jgi:hypothetical protein